MKSLTFVPEGGLANRMRAIASAYNLTKRTDIHLDIIWFKEWGMECRFCDIFEPIVEENINLRDSTFLDWIFNRNPRHRNLYLSKPFIKMRYDKIIWDSEMYALKDSKFDFEKWILSSHAKSYMSSCIAFGSFSDDIYRKLFKPKEFILDRIKHNVSMFSNHTIGMHIRRTDNIDSIKNSPIELFIDKAKSEVENNTETKIFLATDDEDVKHVFKSTFPGRVICSEKVASRDNTDGIIDGTVDMYTLAKTDMIYGSYGSSFSVMASKIYGTPLSILKV